MQKKGPAGDQRIRVVVLTDNAFKKAEYDQCLGEKYGANLFYRKPAEVVTDEVVKGILAEMNPSPHYILREESALINDLNKATLSGLEIVQNPQNAPNLIVNRATLDVWAPKWNNESLAEIKHDQFVHEVKGSIDAKRKEQRDEKVFGWDHLFVNAKTGKTYLDTIYAGWGKNSARQLVLGDFITRYLFYREPQKLTYNKELQPKNCIDFTPEQSVGNFMENNKFLSNENISVWGLDRIRNAILNEGVFFKAATSRPLRNYFSPPFGGVPVTPKKTDVEETVFMMHDLNHHNIPDLIFEGDGSEEMRRVYSAWRMMSEAMTLVIADMLYADTLVRTNPENASKVDSRIYPLYQALNLSGEREEIIRQLLWANTRYALLGDDSAWKKLLKEGQEDKLQAYKNHFEKFFIGDHVWTNANFKNMAAMPDFYKNWITVIGKEQFQKAGLLFLGDIAAKIKGRGTDMNSFEDIVKHTFDEIFETRILQKLRQEPVKMKEEERLKRAFHRYMIGQMSFYFRYQDLAGLHDRAKAMAARLKTSTFDEKEREEIYSEFVKDVHYVWGMGLITSASADNYTQLHPIFPPVYISYNRQESKSVKEQVAKIFEEAESVPPTPSQIPSGWIKVNDAIEKTYKFKNFTKAMEFANKVTDIANQQNHHPELMISWGQVVVKTWTHTTKGLTEKDYKLAESIDGVK